MIKRIIIAGLKGGEGATTITANLAIALEKLDQKTLSIDCTKMNLLKLHFSTQIKISQGWVIHAMNNVALDKAAFESPQGAMFFPFGDLSFQQMQEFKKSQKQVFNTLVDELIRVEETFQWQLILLDNMIENQEEYACLLDSSDLICLVLTPEPSHYNLLHQKIFNQEINSYLQQHFSKTKFIINQFHAESTVSSDFLMVLQKELKMSLIPVHLHYDPAIVECIANLTDILNHAPQSLLAHDFQALAYWYLSYFSPEVQSKSLII
ncbi:cellulose biosynthesis protein BcsQ [uncultured Shewanella sp.]|uniref:cellulose biosynthesis protein BcsQ n=1 Tax=uncultured Shewanella sp. TaxID=173975 RepID=UPI002621B96E|nr:cellulose biosynthesis protein BcsQ [uncultured Shewanella sp.]